MPTYDYRCPANGQVLEVRHKMNELVSNWGELCARLGMGTGDTPADAPVEKLVTGGQVLRSGALNDSAPPCASGPCRGGYCGVE